MKNIFLILVSFLLWAPCALLSSSQSYAQELERPFIWVKAADKPEILEKIANNPWARELFETLRERADKATSRSMAERREKLMVLPLDWSTGKDSVPILRVYGSWKPTDRYEKELLWGYPKEGQVEMIQALQDGIDCGVLYYLTGEVRYAECAGDILSTFVNSLSRMKVEEGYPFNRGWIYSDNHLKEARIIGAQIPIIYDFVHPYLKNGGKVYDVASNDLRPFDFNAAQTVFRTYVSLALNSGLVKSNWPILEAPSLVHNILALDDEKERAEKLPYYLTKDTDHQVSLLTVSKKFINAGDVWPEALGYSRHVANFTFYLMTVLDRIYPELGLGERYSNIPEALNAYYNLQFPNKDYPSIGDGSRHYHVEYLFYEIALHLAILNDNKGQIKTFSNFLSSSIVNGKYKRGLLKSRHSGASPYFTPLQLLWSIEDLGSDEKLEEINIEPARPRTNHLSHAGMYIQRNVSNKEPIKNSMMAVVAGGGYIHGHASGMDMELYGQGYVLGTDGGKGGYGTEIHENYYRLFAAHNTVISNGASASKGPWINLGIDRVKAVAMEPAPNVEAISPKHSFVTTKFFDEHNLVAPARHQRTVALIKLSEDHGYYIDVFRARSDTSEQFHDYIYHNVGDKLILTTDGKTLALKRDEQRYQESAKLPWDFNNTYQHPGWHFFKDVKSSRYSDRPYEAIFTANKLGGQSIGMRAMIPGGLKTEMTQVSAPESYAASSPYDTLPLPTFIMRHKGDAWKNPFTVVYESFSDKPSIQSVERLMLEGEFKGVKVVIEVEGQMLTQYILMQESLEDEYMNGDIGISFKGQFAVITLEKDGSLREAYIGSGQKLSYKDVSLKADEISHAAYLGK